MGLLVARRNTRDIAAVMTFSVVDNYVQSKNHRI